MAKVVFITGASRGIGLATAKRFAKEGWQVAGFYKNKPGPEVPGVKWYQMDITKSSEVESTFSQALTDLGRIDCLVNCAGLFGYQKLAGYTEELMDKVIATNEKGTYFCTKFVSTKMTEGSVVNVSSSAAQVGSSDPIYAASKGAILSFTKAMAKALAPKIRVNAVSPGSTNTDMVKGQDPKRVEQLKELSLLKKIAEPEEVAAGIYFLASDDASHITGACLDISGGYVLR